MTASSLTVDALQTGESYRPPFCFANSAAAIARFPFPFVADEFAYSVNIEPHTPSAAGTVFEFPIDIDEHYLGEMEERRLAMASTPGRYLSLPHMRSAEWDTLELIMTSLAADYPELFALAREAGRWTWINRPLGQRTTFHFGDEGTLPCPPLEFIARQTPGDWCLLDQRDGELWLDAGLATTQADWSLAFNLGMNFTQWHSPVPLAGEAGIFTRSLKYLLDLQLGHPVRRLNWSMTVNPWADLSPERCEAWAPDRWTVTPENVPQRVILRVELQSLWRLPRSGAIAFSIRPYLISLGELATRREWLARLRNVVATLPDALIDYKGLRPYYDTLRGWLATA